jgi:U6 snRNA-associated Sm-like protein LSm1
MLGEIDLDKDDYVPEPFKQASPEEVHAIAKEQAAERKRKSKVKSKALGEEGFEAEGAGEVLY